MDCYLSDENGMRLEVSKKVTISSVARQLQHEKGKPHGLGVTILSFYKENQMDKKMENEMETGVYTRVMETKMETTI